MAAGRLPVHPGAPPSDVRSWAWSQRRAGTIGAVSAPRIGLVLGSGGLAGTAFHAGVLTALARDVGWDARDAEVVVGTSAGSTSAALLRAGFPPGDYVSRITGEAMSADGERLMRDIAPVSVSPPRRSGGWPAPASTALLRRALLRPGSVHPGALLAGALPLGATPNGDVAAAIGPLHAQGWPERSLWVCAVRMDTGARVVFGRDIDAPPASVAEAVTASCAIPAYFAPPVIDGVRYVDGGVRSLCNLDLMAGLGLDLVIVSAPMSSSAWVEPRRDVALRTWARAQLEREARRVRASGTPVLLLHPGAAARAAMAGGAMNATCRPAIARTVRDRALKDLGAENSALLQRLAAG